jgi:hypothetical protein
MDAADLKEIEQLRSLPVSGLREKYRNVFEEDSRSNHKDYLYRRIAWRLAAERTGGGVGRELRGRSSRRRPTRPSASPTRPSTTVYRVAAFRAHARRGASRKPDPTSDTPPPLARPWA